ncbi:MAG: DUF4105 domain-containing protein [Candidatus Wallbacteria bacterium]|nr:DUF4105 domain-containing protein [Candidatus Wallbacteria bacterium]
MSKSGLKRTGKSFLTLAMAVLTGMYLQASTLCTDQRELKILSQQGTVYQLDNVRWGFEGSLVTKAPVFKKTKIDISRVRDVYFWLETFPPEALAGHGMLAFVMDSPCVESEDGKTDIGLVYSFEAWLEQGKKYSPVEGMKKDTYRLIYQVSTVKDRIQLSIVIPQHKMYQYKVNLTQQQKQELCALMLAESAVDRSMEYYHTYFNSCVFNALRLVNKVLPSDRKLRMYIADGCPNLFVTFPPVVPDYLTKHGLICEKRLFTIASQIMHFPFGSGHAYDINFSDLQHGDLGKASDTDEDVDLAERLEYLLLAKEIYLHVQGQTPVSQQEYQEQLSELLREITSEEADFLARFTESTDTLAWNLRWFVKKEVDPKLVDTIDNELIIAICEALKHDNPHKDFLLQAKLILIERQAAGR